MKHLNLLKISNEKITLNEAALGQFEKHPGPISIVSACGEYRTGKSFLLNCLFAQNCFDVSCTTEACTKGINMMAHPIREAGRNLWVFDTEGFGSIEKDARHDGIIFMLGVLLSEVFIYNSMGAIDEGSLSKMALMCKQAQRMASPDDAQALKDDIELLWMLRDFSLELTDKEGRAISSDQYLEESLHGSSPKAQLQRRCIRKMFSQRRCYPLVRPCVSEHSLNNLQNEPNDMLRPQFIKEVENIRRHILQSARVKKIDGQEVDGAQFVQMLRGFVKIINEGDYSVSLNVVWEQVQQHLREEAMMRIEEEMRGKIGHYEKMLPLPDDEVERLPKQFAMIVAQLSEGLRHNPEHLAYLSSQSLSLQGQLLSTLQTKNQIKTQEKCQSYLHDCYRGILTKLAQASNNGVLELTGFFELFKGVMTKLRDGYDTRFGGFDRGVVEGEYSTMLEKVIQDILMKCIRKWGTQAAEKNERAEAAAKAIKSLQTQLKQKAVEEDSYRKELNVNRKLLEQERKNTANYIEVISRLEKLSQTLKTEYKILEEALTQTTSQYELQIGQYKQDHEAQLYKIQGLQSELQQLQSTIAQAQVQHQSQISQLEQAQNSKYHQLLQLLSSQRLHFQQLLIQKSKQERDLKTQLHQTEVTSEQAQKQLLEATRKIKAEMEKAVEDRQRQAEIALAEREYQLKEMEVRLAAGERDRQGLIQKLEGLLLESNAKTSQLMKSTGLLEELKLQMQRQRTQHSHEVASLNKKVLEKDQQLQGEQSRLLQIEVSYREKLAKNKQQLSQMLGKLEQNRHDYEHSFKQKHELMKEQLAVEKSAVAQKLTEAAERIQQISAKQKSIADRMGQVQAQNQRLLDDNVKLKQIIEAMSSKQKERDNEGNKNARQEIIELRAEIERMHQLVSQKDQALLILQNKLAQLSKSVEQTLPRPSNHQTSQDKLLAQKLAEKLEYLLSENNRLKLQADRQRSRTDKTKNIEYKAINLHAFFKKTLAHPSQSEPTLSKTQPVLTRSSSPKWTGQGTEDLNLTNLSYGQLYTQLQSTLNYLQEYQTRVEAQMADLDALVVMQREEIEALSRKEAEYLDRIEQEIKKAGEMRSKWEAKYAEARLECDRSKKEVAQSSKKLALLSREVELWKMKASQGEAIESMQEIGSDSKIPARGRSYRSKLNQVWGRI